ncbi:MAG TPA: hypothetical protein VK961_24495, partial [Chthoniobacter sp.]|nr:hypothetical protein [Chthoniobacter sp.]
NMSIKLINFDTSCGYVEMAAMTPLSVDKSTRHRHAPRASVPSRPWSTPRTEPNQLPPIRYFTVRNDLPADQG